KTGSQIPSSRPVDAGAGTSGSSSTTSTPGTGVDRLSGAASPVPRAAPVAAEGPDAAGDSLVGELKGAGPDRSVDKATPAAAAPARMTAATLPHNRRRRRSAPAFSPASSAACVSGKQVSDW